MERETALVSRHRCCSSKRKLTEDRRRQNREAQRRYRERRKPTRDIPDHEGYRDVSDVLPTTLDTAIVQTTQVMRQDGSSSDHDSGSNNLMEGSPFFDLDDVLLLGTTKTLQEDPYPVHTAPNVLPSPYRNHLTIQKLSFYAARIQNALHLGLPMALAQKEDEISPWYWYTQYSILLSSELVHEGTGNIMESSFELHIQRPIRRRPCFCMSEDAVAPDLMPTSLQRSHPHGMYLDMIPFPVFRDRAITLLSMKPAAFDEAELKRDIENEGLMVWGVGHGSTSRAATLVRDKRNWECSKWFYRKWRLLIDGSGLEEQSQWWRDMRGEEDSDGATPL